MKKEDNCVCMDCKKDFLIYNSRKNYSWGLVFCTYIFLTAILPIILWYSASDNIDADQFAIDGDHVPYEIKYSEIKKPTNPRPSSYYYQSSLYTYKPSSSSSYTSPKPSSSSSYVAPKNHYASSYKYYSTYYGTANYYQFYYGSYSKYYTYNGHKYYAVPTFKNTVVLDNEP